MVARIDLTAVATAAGVGLAVILAGAAVSGVLASRAGGLVVWLFLAVVVTGFASAGLVAGHLRSDTPMLHGALGAAAAYAIALLIGLVVAALRNRSINIVAVPLAALTAITAGVAGSLLADAVHRHTLRRHPVSG